MATSKIDFKKLNQDLLSRVLNLLPQWLPGGKLVGNEFCCGDIAGGEGDSLKVNINSGLWADFASGEKGGDLISLYAAVKNIKQIEAARELDNKSETSSVRSPQQSNPASFAKPKVPLHKFKHYKLGEPSKTWEYRDQSGDLCFYISRYETDKGKELRPWSYSDGKWTNKAWPENRPLYGAETVKRSAVLIVEGEKCADSAREFASKYYDVVTWSGGAQAINKTDWTPLYDKKILIWPDADKPGIKAANEIAALLHDHTKEIKIIDVSLIETQGWDAADSNFTESEFVAWAKPRAKVYERPLPAVIPSDYGYAERMEDHSQPDMPPDAPMHIVMQDSSESNNALTKDQLEYLVSLDLSFQANGKTPHANADNVGRICLKDQRFVGKFWYDDFYKRIYTNYFGETQELSDSILIKIAVELQRFYNMVKMSKTTVDEGIKSYVFDQIRNEPRDWMETLTWDGNSRIDGFFRDYMGAQDSEYCKAISKNFFISMIARIYQPGCKVDNMVILEGNQGTYKSSALKALGGKWYVDTVADTSTKDFYLILQGRMIVELGELTSFNKGESTAIKRAVTTASDVFRTPFDKYPAEHGRTSVFVGTTNQDEYLADSTGGRRFWPLTINTINLDGIKLDRDQLFAEAVHRYKAGESWWIVPDSAKLEQDQRQEGDVWTERVEKYLYSPQRTGSTIFTIDEVLEFGLNVTPDKMNKNMKDRVGNILRKLGLQNKAIRVDGKLKKRWLILNENGSHVTHVSLRQDGLLPNNVAIKKLPNFAPGMENE